MGVWGPRVNKEYETSVHLHTRGFFCFRYLDQIWNIVWDTLPQCPLHARQASFQPPGPIGITPASALRFPGLVIGG